MVKDINNIELIELDPFDIRMIESNVKQRGALEECKSLLNYIDCSKPHIQTIDYTYKLMTNKIIYIVEHYMDDDNQQKSIMEDLFLRHRANLEYERENPPTVYKVKKKSSKTKQPKEHKEKIVKPKNKFKDVKFVLKLNPV